MSYEDPGYYDIDLEFDLVAIVRYILAFKKADVFNMDNYKSLTYEEIMAGLYAR